MGDKPSDSTPPSVGSLLKRRRQSLKLSLATVELATKIRGKYLISIEASEVDQLPNDIYTRGFITKYADYLGLDADAVTKQYIVERGGFDTAALVGSPKPVRGRSFTVTPRLLIAGAFLVAMGLVVVYLGWQFSALAAAPRLQVDAPPGDLSVEGSTLAVAGHVAGGADVFINDSPVLTDANGGFNNKLALQDGLNVIKVVATNKLNKSTTVTRNILAHLPALGGQPLVPPAVFDGIAIGVTVKDSATNITTSIDGAKPTTITMLPGTVLSFSGKSKISLTTTNSAKTAIVITNAQVAAKDLGTIGKGGKTTLELAKDTAFP